VFCNTTSPIDTPLRLVPRTFLVETDLTKEVVCPWFP
jgi:hypothetical protein